MLSLKKRQRVRLGALCRQEEVKRGGDKEEETTDWCDSGMRVKNECGMLSEVYIRCLYILYIYIGV